MTQWRREGGGGEWRRVGKRDDGTMVNDTLGGYLDLTWLKPVSIMAKRLTKQLLGVIFPI